MEVNDNKSNQNKLNEILDRLLKLQINYCKIHDEIDIQNNPIKKGDLIKKLGGVKAKIEKLTKKKNDLICIIDNL